MSDNRPIGVLDSGLGGLTVVKEVIRQLPNEDVVFIGDEARMPYGVKTHDQIISYTREMVQYLISQNVKLIIYGCNTATANALQTLRQEFTVPMIGVIKPGSEEASKVTKSGHIGIIGTESTINSKSYNKTIQEINPKLTSLGVAAQKFVSFVENDQADTKETKDNIEVTLKPFKDNDYDTLILGCTHFPMLKKQINDYLPDTKLIDPAVSTVKVTTKYLTENDLLTDSKQRTLKLYATSDIEEFSRLAKRWLKTDIDEISLVNIGGNDERNNNSN
ncbi:glutamate racemase [Companilactobacillus paralimentarius DSM 13238 = JCM 10415]|jgi:glutamate racemase|uniref:Glutamate racemase n=1 Tax=Companilactobacillus paralimentarius DSM 13238 = JCM 10415 TaxID=1122151 RepID=A0A0R1PSG8_9LACO|nr:glutamate racemase [Companilactobacillus paralimentarius]KAE9563049.1 glutamate racemase [Companilactobacillus paralimentarius]KRL31859.1 glutamate racemase [Companilactobacillus paralimentarius DSM 13238 = JCM 10415]MDR4933419.1 glutamate racemase [Companilactobacillus paralimentarius]QFR69905.1 glutamate racemase [Companilactobacillus paralimentarius]